jgi:DNA-binding GntR family transcriptional regulator
MTMQADSSREKGDGNGPLQLERVYQEIKFRVVYGRYRPGTSLSESVLARVHRSSRTPVREALSRLGEEGYVERLPRRGYIVAPITINAIQNAYEVRLVLETAGAGYAAARADEAAIAAMAELADYPTLEASDESYRERLTVNERFHLAVASAGQNGNLVELVRHSLAQHNRVLSLGVERPILSGSVPQHHAIVEAIRSRDAAASSEAMRKHLDDAHQLVMDFLMRGRLRGVGLA